MKPRLRGNAQRQEPTGLTRRNGSRSLANNILLFFLLQALNGRPGSHCRIAGVSRPLISGAAFLQKLARPPRRMALPRRAARLRPFRARPAQGPILGPDDLRSARTHGIRGTIPLVLPRRGRAPVARRIRSESALEGTPQSRRRRSPFTDIEPPTGRAT